MRDTLRMSIAVATAALICGAGCPKRPDGQVVPGGQLGALSGPFAPPGKAAQISGRVIEDKAEGPWKVRREAGREAEHERHVPRSKSAVMEATASLAPSPARSASAPSSPPSSPRGGAADEMKAPVRRDSPGLRAGSTDDNAEFAEFLKFLAARTVDAFARGQHDPLDVQGRTFVRVVDGKGSPLPAADVRITDVERDRLTWAGTTYGDGRTPYFPRVAAKVGGEPSRKLVVEAAAGGARKRVEWNGSGGDLTVELADARPSPALALDVVFVIDTTGSMGDEIDRIKGTLLKVTERLRSLKLEFDLRYGAVLYRDLGDEYVTMAYPLTTDIEGLDKALQAVGADGGGDGPESVNQALAEAMGLDWRPGAAKVAFLIGDAPPHMDYADDVPYGRSLLAAVGRGIRIHSVAASGLEEYPQGALVFRQIAQFTRGRFIFIEYGSTEAAAAMHGVTGAVASNNLDDIIYEQIRDELARWGREAPLQVSGR